MLARFMLAILGASIITVGLLLGMDAFTSLFRDRDEPRYFLIDDVLPRADSGRPERPAASAEPPDTPRFAPERPETRITVDPPTAPGATLDRPQLSLDPVSEPPGDETVDD